METHDLLQHYLGDFGTFQQYTTLLAILVAPNFGVTVVAMTFLMATPEHHCRVNEPGSSGEHRLSPESLNHSIPLENLNGRSVYSSCLMYVQTNETKTGENRTITSCTHGYLYDQSQYRSTIVTEHDLVCERTWLNEMGKSVFFVGSSLGSIVSGIAADRFGRHPTTLLFLLLHLVFGVGAAFATDYVTFVILRALVGAAGIGFYFTSLVIAIEIAGPSKRNAVGMASVASCAFGYVILGFLAYLIRDWWTLQLAQALMTAPFLCYWWLLSESPRWLLTNNRVDEAKAVIQRAAKMNKVVIPHDAIFGETEKLSNDSEEDSSRQYGVLDLFRKPRIRKTTMTMCISWFAEGCVYFGLILASVEWAGNPYLNFILGSLLEVFLSAVSLAAMERWGRKPVIGGTVLVAGTCSMVSAMTKGFPTVSRGFALVGRGAIGISFLSLIVYTPEVFPTVVRGTGLGLANMCSRLGSVLTPFVSLLGDVWQPLPMVTFGTLCFVASLAIYTLPETLGVPLPDTLEDSENFGRKQLHSDEIKDVSYTNPWPIPTPMKYTRRLVVFYQTARDGDFFRSSLVLK
ncbi:organic cation transporter protein-like isoform X2 [Branchiostoma floridae]|uniref:Organic cation transporter protein-like isoform X2 n=1 Tax=Branchiostoma floridae TaxID=7739 RepID=A0A9J7MY57_BRAFL|nr:organic cation transporter protein-like isoform X2 [Branchiostoma floridae]